MVFFFFFFFHLIGCTSWFKLVKIYLLFRFFYSMGFTGIFLFCFCFVLFVCLFVCLFFFYVDVCQLSFLLSLTSCLLFCGSPLNLVKVLSNFSGL